MLSSSRSDSKQEARFATRIDVLGERIDTLAATVATTASAIAKKDGEIAGLRRDLHARDEALEALVAQARAAAQAPAGGPAVEANELRSLKNALAALTKEHAQGGAGRVSELAATVRSLAQRVDALSTAVSASPARPATDPAVTERLVAMQLELESLRAQVEHHAAEPERQSDELLGMLATLRSQVAALGDLRSGVTEEQLAERLAVTDDGLTRLSQRIDSLAQSVESAAASLRDKEHELTSLHRHFTESSTRIEHIVDDIREALSAFPELGSASIDDLATRLERVEASTRKAAETNARAAGELTGRIDAIDQRVAAVAAEVARAKTLWPVALRSLEARLDDAVHPRRPESTSVEDEALPAGAEDDPADDLLAGLRDSLQAMETVAAEMARASETLSGSDGDSAPPEPQAARPEGAAESEPYAGAPEPPVAAAGATILPLRTGDP